MLRRDSSNDSSSHDSSRLEGLFLKLHLERQEEIPAAVVSKLSLRQDALKPLSAEELMLLAEMLAKANRQADGARVAVAAAELFVGNEDESQQFVADVWGLLYHNINHDESLVKAASLVLATFNDRLTAKLEELEMELLRQSCGYLFDKDNAMSFAADFFQSDLGISAMESWPPRSSASIFAAMASRLDEQGEKLQLLVQAHSTDSSDEHIRCVLAKHLSQYMLCRDSSNDSSSHDSSRLEGLFLKLHLERQEEIPAAVVSKLSLRQDALKPLSAEELMLLAEMLAKANRQADGARVAVAAAELFVANGNEDESHRAFAYAYYLDCANDLAAFKLCELLGSIRHNWKDLSSKWHMLDSKCQDLGAICDTLTSTCQDLGHRSADLGEKYKDLLDKYNELKGECQELRDKCNAPQKPCEAPIMSLKWDLSTYDFTNFTEDQEQLSDEFQLGASGVEAWLELHPKASPDKASLYLHVSEPVWAKWRCQVGSWEDTTEWEFAKEADGSLNGYGFEEAIPFSDLASGIAFDLLSVRRAGSSLRLVAPGS